MESKTKYFRALANLAFYLVGLILLITVVPKIIVFFLPFVVGGIISLIANPIVKFFEEKIKFKRKATSMIAIILILAIVIMLCYAVGYLIISQGLAFVTSLPAKWPTIEEKLNAMGTAFNQMFSNMPVNTMESLNSIGRTAEEELAGFISKLGTPTLAAVSSVAKSLPATIVGIVMAILSAYFFTTEHNKLSEGIKKYCPKDFYERLMTVYRGIKRAVGGYFRAQFIIEIWVYLIIVVGLLILKIEYAAVIALGIAFLDFLPLFGAGLIMIPWAVIAFFSGDYFVAVGMLVVWGVGQLVRQIIQPKIVGDSVGMDPLPTLFWLFIGYQVGGVFGMIVAVPIGIIFVSFYEEGVFKTLIDSVKLLWVGMSNFRHFKPGDLNIIENSEEKKE